MLNSEIRQRGIALVQEIAPLSDEDAGHVFDRIVLPSIHAAIHGGVVDLVCTNPDAPGYDVTCAGCGRTAKVPVAPLAGQAALCPDCVRIAHTTMKSASS